MQKIEYRFDIARFNAHIKDSVNGKGVRSIGNAAGVSASTISRMQNGTAPDLKTFMDICAALGLNPADYFERIVWERVSGGEMD